MDTDVFNEWMNEEDYCVNERNSPVNFRQRINLQEEQVCVCIFLLQDFHFYFKLPHYFHFPSLIAGHQIDPHQKETTLALSLL